MSNLSITSQSLFEAGLRIHRLRQEAFSLSVVHGHPLADLMIDWMYEVAEKNPLKTVFDCRIEAENAILGSK